MAQANIAENGNPNNGFPALSLVQGHPRASSLTIAEHFGKRHKDVLRSITQTCHHLPGEFTERNFALSEFTDSTGRKLPAYLMTRDGFTMVVMGFTGKDAMAWKLKYIEAFNRMEEELRMQSSQPEPLALSSVADRRPMVNLVNVWCKAANIPQPVAYTQVAGHFGLDRVTQLPAAWIADAVAFVQARIDAATPKALPAPDEDLRTAMVAHHRAYRPELRTVEDAVMAACAQLRIIEDAVARAAHAADGSNITMDTSLAQKSYEMVVGRSETIRHELRELESLAVLGFAGIAVHLELKHARNDLRQIEKDSKGRFKSERLQKSPW